MTHCRRAALRACLPILVGAAVAAAPAPARADVCSPQALPAGAAPAAADAEVVVWSTNEGNTLSGCLRPAGAPVRLVTADTPTAAVAGDWAYVRYGGGMGPGFPPQLAARNLRTGVTYTVILGGAVVNDRGEAAGLTLSYGGPFTQSLLVVVPRASRMPVPLALDPRGAKYRFTPRGLVISEAGHHLFVDLRARALPAPPRRLPACRLLSASEVRRAGGHGAGDVPKVGGTSCDWGYSLSLTKYPRLSRSEQTALISTSHWDRLQVSTVGHATLVSAVGFEAAVVYAVEDGTLLAVEERYFGHAPRRAPLRRAALAALARLGLRR